MKEEIKITIPMPLLVSIEDVGWWSGKDGSNFNQPFRTGMHRDHVPEDYIALAALGKGLDMRVLAGFVLCEWDKADILKKLPSSTWMGEKWTMLGKKNEQKERAAWIIKEERKYIELGLHGVGHEFWIDNKMERTEFHNDMCEMRDRDEIRKHIVYFFKLMDQYNLDFRPQTFIPPALKHSFGNHDEGFQKILSEFGIRYVTLIFNKARIYSRPQTNKIAWENNVLLVERGESDVKWNVAVCEPEFKFDRPVMALHWANILHPDPKKNLIVVDNWIKYIKEKSEKKDILLTRDTESCFTQYLHKVMSKVEKTGEQFSIDVSWIKKVPANLLNRSLFLKVDTPPGIKLKISGAKVQPTFRSAETTFLKLNIPIEEKKIFVKPCT